MDPKKKEIADIKDSFIEWAELDPTDDKEFLKMQIRDEEIYSGCDPEFF